MKTSSVHGSARSSNQRCSLPSICTSSPRASRRSRGWWKLRRCLREAIGRPRSSSRATSRARPAAHDARPASRPPASSRNPGSARAPARRLASAHHPGCGCSTAGHGPCARACRRRPTDRSSKSRCTCRVLSARTTDADATVRTRLMTSLSTWIRLRFVTAIGPHPGAGHAAAAAAAVLLEARSSVDVAFEDGTRRRLWRDDEHVVVPWPPNKVALRIRNHPPPIDYRIRYVMTSKYGT